MNPKVTDVHQTLAYRRGEVTGWVLVIGAVFMLIGAYGVFFDELTGDDRRRPAAWLILAMGGLMTAFQLYEFLVPGKPALALSPEGLLVRIEWITEFLIPWPKSVSPFSSGAMTPILMILPGALPDPGVAGPVVLVYELVVPDEQPAATASRAMTLTTSATSTFRGRGWEFTPSPFSPRPPVVGA